MSLFKREDFLNESGTILGKGLFLELSYSKQDRVLFTMKEVDHRGFVSFPRLYMELTEADPTEWTMAEEVFTSWTIWEKISNMSMIKPYVEELRKQAAIRTKSKALKAVILKANDPDNKDNYAASKYLIDKNLTQGNTKKKRTAKAKEEELKAAEAMVQSDADLVKLKVVK